MILFTKPLLTFLITSLIIDISICTEFVPVYMWGMQKVTDHVPALHRISEDSFKDTLLEYLDEKPYIVIFAENTLSPEDFAQHFQDDKSIYTHISELKKSFSVAYKPYVQNPIGAVKQLDRKVTELSISSLINNPNVPEDNVLIIDLNDARDSEHRFHMLKRHDADIVTIYKELLKQHGNVLAIYTARHTSWIAPEDLTQKKSRSLLQSGDTPNNNGKLFDSSNALMYLTDEGIYMDGSQNYSLNQFTSSSSLTDQNVVVFILENSNENNKINFTFTFGEDGYWSLGSVEYIKGTNKVSLQGGYSLNAPEKFSYHCGDFVLREAKKDSPGSLILPGFQIQPFLSANSSNRFGDAYDCVGFTSVPIWSGLFVTFILLLIMTFGLTMMMDIKTMDRFDDAKGKTITINASE